MPTSGFYKKDINTVSSKNNDPLPDPASTEENKNVEASTSTLSSPKNLSNKKSTRNKPLPKESTARAIMRITTIALGFSAALGQRISPDQSGANRFQLANPDPSKMFGLKNQADGFLPFQCPVNNEPPHGDIDIEKFKEHAVLPLPTDSKTFAPSDSTLNGISATQACTRPDPPGLEEAFSYLCLQDRSAYDYATELLRKMDVIVGKLQGFNSGRENQLISDYSKKRLQLQKTANKEHIQNIQNELSVIKDQLDNRYSRIYGNDTSEIGTSGKNSFRLHDVIAATHPSQGVALREKMALSYAHMWWLPMQIQKKAEVEAIQGHSAWIEREAAMTEEERIERLDKLKSFIDSLKLDFPIDIEQLSRYSITLSPTIREFHFRENEPDAPEGRLTNTIYFEPREKLFGSPWVLRDEHKVPRDVELASWDPKLDELHDQCVANTYQPKYDKTQTDKLTGTHYFVAHEQRDWYKKNHAGDNLISMTGPSGTSDLYIRLENMFMFSLDQKIAGLKARIAHLHLDRHHSIHEILLASNADSELNEYLRYDGSLKALERLDPDLYHQAVAIQPQFMEREIALRNHLENEQRLVLAEAEFNP